MLSLLRKHAASTMIKVILGLIVIVFVFWGFEGFQARQSGRVALVNGKSITVDEFRRTYNNLIEGYRQQYGENFNQELLDALNPQQRALDLLIEQRLVLSEAEKLDIRIPDEVLAESIRKINAFQTGGVFDVDKYESILRRNRLTPEEFENQQRRGMLVSEVRDFITSNVKVSDAEAMEYFQWDKATVKLDYVVFDPKKFEDIPVDDEKLAEYFEKNEEKFKTQPMIKVRYVTFKPSDFEADVNVTEEEIKEYYESNPDEFKKEKTVQARHILFKVEEDAEESVVEEKRKKAMEVLEKARKGEDFAELAKKYSEGPSADRGGDLGEFKKSTMVKPFADKAFSMKPGEISEPVKTQFGWHIIKVEKVNEAKTLTLEEASEQIRERFVKERARQAAYEAAEMIYNVSFEGDDLINAAEDKGLGVRTTDFFDQAGPPDFDVVMRPKFTKAAFALSDMEISDIVELQKGFYIMQRIERKEPEVPPFEEVKEKVKKAYIEDRQREMAREKASGFLEKLQEGAAMADLASEFEVEISQTDFFGRGGAIPGIGYEQSIIGVAFELNEENKYPEEPIRGRKGFYVIGFSERKVPDTAEFEEKKESVINELRVQKRFKIFDQWVLQVRNSAEISIEKGFISG